MGRVSVIVAVGIIFGILAKRYNLPGGAVVGSMLGSGLAAMILPGSFIVPDKLSTAIQVMLGVSLGMTFDRSFLPTLVKVLPVAMVSTVVLLAVSMLLAVVADRFGLIDFSTALFGFSPGGMSGMSLLAQSEGYHTATVAFIHTIRIFTLFLLVPLLGRIAWFKAF
jgi:membrane AbrB-like protein